MHHHVARHIKQSPRVAALPCARIALDTGYIDTHGFTMAEALAEAYALCGSLSDRMEVDEAWFFAPDLTVDALHLTVTFGGWAWSPNEEGRFQIDRGARGPEVTAAALCWGDSERLYGAWSKVDV